MKRGPAAFLVVGWVAWLSSGVEALTKIRDPLASKPAGSPFKVTVLRAGKVLDVTGKVQ